MIKKSLLIAAQLTIAAVLFLISFQLAPWFACKPLSALAQETAQHSPAPVQAKCYTIDHGQIIFRNHATIAEDPLSFALVACLWILLFGLLMWSLWWARAKAKES